MWITMQDAASKTNLTKRQVYSRILHVKRCGVEESLFVAKEENGRITAVNFNYISKQSSLKKFLKLDEYNMTLEEISAVLGIPLTQVRALEQTALTKIRNRLREYMEL